MLNRTQYYLFSFVLFICIIVTGCGHAAISQSGESLHSGEAQQLRVKEYVNDEDQETDGNGLTLESNGEQSSSIESANNQSEPVEDTEEHAFRHQQQEADATLAQSDILAESAMQEDQVDQTETVSVERTEGSNTNSQVPPQTTEKDGTQSSQAPMKTSPLASSTGQETPEQAEWDSENNTLTFKELYASVGVRGIELSDKVKGLNGKEVEMSGYMAPPLTAGVKFFVLTKTLMAVCPFCSTDADWPTDIVVVYLPEGEDMNPTEHPVKVTGKLDTGSYTDEETGFVSLVRIYADKVEVMK